MTELVAVFLAFVATAACARSAEQARRRDAGYQAQLAAYSAALKPGITRKDVEAYLGKNGREFRQMCTGTRGVHLWLSD